MEKYSNEHCELARITGKFEGLNKYLTSLKKISKSPDCKVDLTEEIKRVEKEIMEAQNQMTNEQLKK